MIRPSWHAWWVLLWPRRIRHHLDLLVAQGVIAAAPNLWQMELGILRMWHRVLFRFDSIGTCQVQAVRPTWRASLLQFRPMRFVFLRFVRAIVPLDHSGLAQPPSRMIRHLLAAHHDCNQFAYDLEILQGSSGSLESLRTQASEVTAGQTSRARWLADLCVFEGYHQALLEATDRAIAGQSLVDPDEEDDPDLSFDAYIRWCRAQPSTPGDTWRAWRAGTFPRSLLV